MKLLLDECIVQDFRHLVRGHEVFTVGYQQWSGMSNGRLLRLAAEAGFDALLTTDRGFADQHNPVTIPLAIVILHARSNDLADLEPLVGTLLECLESLAPRSIAHVRVV